MVTGGSLVLASCPRVVLMPFWTQASWLEHPFFCLPALSRPEVGEDGCGVGDDAAAPVAHNRIS